MYTLTDCIIVNDKRFQVNTGYRYWLKFYTEAMSGGKDFRFLFSGKTPYVSIGGEWITTKKVMDAISRFFMGNKDPETNAENGRDDLLDYEIDEPLIYAAFLQQYDIDLYDETTDLHWHKFRMLLEAVTDATLLGKVIGYRAYSGKDKEILKLQRTWALPVRLTSEEQEQIDKFNAL